VLKVFRLTTFQRQNAAESERRVSLTFSERVTITGAIISRAATVSNGDVSAEQGALSPIAASGEAGGISAGVSALPFWKYGKSPQTRRQWKDGRLRVFPDN